MNLALQAVALALFVAICGARILDRSGEDSVCVFIHIFCQFPERVVSFKSGNPLFSELTDHSVTNDHVEFECKTRNFQIYEVRDWESLLFGFFCCSIV